MFRSIFCRELFSLSSLRTSLRLLVLVVFVLYNDTAYSADRIIGGEEVAKTDQYPWMVSLRDAATGEHVCGATLVHRRWVMSASHCFYELPAEAISVYVGDYDLTKVEETEQRFSVVSRVESGRDLMLLELAEAVDTKVFPPLNIASSAVLDGVAVGDLLVTIGWGDRDPQPNYVDEDTLVQVVNEDFPDVLHEVSVPVYNQFDCYVNYGNGDLSSVFKEGEYLPISGAAIDDKHICAGYTEEQAKKLEIGFRGSCSGDSGGPLLTFSGNEWYQVGVASFAPETCGAFDAPSVFTKVTEFKDWIDGVIYAAELVIDTSSLPTQLTTSLVEDDVVSVCDQSGDESLVYKLKNANIYPVRLVNQGDDMVAIKDVELLVETGTITCDGALKPYTPTEFSVVSSDDSPECKGTDLGPGEICELNLRVNFLSSGFKSTALKLTYDNSDLSDVFDLNFNAIGEAEFSPSFGDGVFFFTEKRNEWEFRSNIVSELVSDFTLYESSTLIAKIDGGGQLGFDWKIDDERFVDFSVWLNGEHLTDFQPQEAYSRETLVLPSDQINTVVWKRVKGSIWDFLEDVTPDQKSRAAYLKSVTFVSDKPIDNEDSQVEDSKSESGGALNPMLTLLAFIFLVFKRGGVGYRSFVSAAVLMFGLVSASYAEKRIIGGSDAEALAYPWMVSLQDKYTGEHYCGGTLVDEFYVLTASHCYTGEALDRIQAVVGVHDLGDATNENLNVKTVGVVGYVMPEWDGEYLLFQLSEALGGSSVQLATEADMRKVGEGDSLKVLGWGDTDPADDSQNFPDVLQEVDVVLMNHGDCQDVYSSIEEHEVRDDMLCAGLPQGGSDACQGDSGGPLLWQNEFGEWVQVGITDFGIGCGSAEYPGVYTRVASYNSLFNAAIDWSEITVSAMYLGEMVEESSFSYRLNLTSNVLSPFDISWVQFESDDVMGFQVVGDQCSNDILYFGDSCSLDLKLSFELEGKKNTFMSVLFPDGSSKSYPLSVMVYPESDLQMDGDTLDLVSAPNSAWRKGESGDLLIDMPESDDVSRFGAHLSQSGLLSFDWRLMNAEMMNLDVYVNGSRHIFTSLDNQGEELLLQAESEVSSVSLEIQEGGAYVEWVLARKSEPSLNEGQEDDASISMIQFTPSSENDQSTGAASGEKSSSGGGVSAYYMLLCLLLLVRRSTSLVRPRNRW